MNEQKHYNDLCEKSVLLDGARERCVRNQRFDMADVWRKKRNEINAKIVGLMVKTGLPK